MPPRIVILAVFVAMGSDLSTLSVLILDGRGHLGAIQVSILRALGVTRMSVLSEPSTLHKTMRLYKPDCLLVNGLTETAFWSDVLRQVRYDRASPDPYVPVVLMAPGISRRVLFRAIELGVDSIMAMPARPTDVLRHLERLAAGDRTFVRRVDYFGPCRRRSQDPTYDGVDRRRGTADGETHIMGGAEVVLFRTEARQRPDREPGGQVPLEAPAA